MIFTAFVIHRNFVSVSRRLQLIFATYLDKEAFRTFLTVQHLSHNKECLCKKLCCWVFSNHSVSQQGLISLHLHGRKDKNDKKASINDVLNRPTWVVVQDVCSGPALDEIACKTSMSVATRATSVWLWLHNCGLETTDAGWTFSYWILKNSLDLVVSILRSPAVVSSLVP